ncbi:MAG: hypothetical protein QXP52_01155 [Candidatus Aenigmatarchaeota archaeon]
MKIEKIKEICGGSYSVVLSEKIDFSLIKNFFEQKPIFDELGILKYKIDSKEITFFDSGEIVFKGFKKEEILDFLNKLKKSMKKNINS